MTWPPTNAVTGDLLLIPMDMHSVDHEGAWFELQMAAAAGDLDTVVGVISPSHDCPQCGENRRRREAYYGVDR